MVCDTHCHFFSSRFLELLTQGTEVSGDRAAAVSTKLGWDPPGTPEELADRWVAELDRHTVARVALIASMPGDEASVRTAVVAPSDTLRRLLHVQSGAPAMLARASSRCSRAGICGSLRSFRRCTAIAWTIRSSRRCSKSAADAGAAVFVHCGMLTVGVRKRLGLPSPFDLRLGDPLAVAAVAARYPAVPVIIPHFGAGFFREALMAADQCANILLDTSSSNGWMKYYPGLTLEGVFQQALAVAGPDRLLFGTDSSFFPRGWQKPVHDAQVAALAAVRATHEARSRVMGGNFARLFPLS